MSKAPVKCLYCNGNDPNCGFCEKGIPLDTQEDWDRSWGNLDRWLPKRGLFNECD